MNINTHTEAQLALREGKTLRNIRYSENEYVFMNLAQNQLETEDGHLHGLFHDEFWQLQLRLPQRWYIINNQIKN